MTLDFNPAKNACTRAVSHWLRGGSDFSTVSEKQIKPQCNADFPSVATASTDVLELKVRTSPCMELNTTWCCTFMGSGTGATF
jgi:hypothetical protein